MASEISDEMVEAAARALCRERISAYFTDPVKREAYITDYVEKHWTGYDEGARASLTAALAVQARTHVVVDKANTASSIAGMVAEWYYGALARSGRRHIPAAIIEQRLERLSMLAASTGDKP